MAFGPAEVPFTLQQLRYQWTTRTMQAFCLVLGGLLCSLQMLWRRVTRISAATAAEAEQQRAAEQQRLAEQQRMEAGGDAWADEQQLLAPARGTGGLLREPDTLAVFGGAVLFSAVASFVGAWSVLFSKSLTYVVTALPASLGDWYSWVVLVAFLGTAAFWVRQSNRGLKLYPATLIMPLMQVRHPRARAQHCLGNTPAGSWLRPWGRDAPMPGGGGWPPSHGAAPHTLSWRRAGVLDVHVGHRRRHLF